MLSAGNGVFYKLKKKNAYFTVEAALVLPLVMGALLLIIFLFIFQYDRCLMEQDIGLLVLYAGTLEAEDTEEASMLLNRRISEIYWDKYVAWETEKLQITVEKNEVKVEGEGKLTFPVPGWNFFNDDNVWRTQAARSAVRFSPVDFIRVYRRIRGGE